MLYLLKGRARAESLKSLFSPEGRKQMVSRSTVMVSSPEFQLARHRSPTTSSRLLRMKKDHSGLGAQCGAAYKVVVPAPNRIGIVK